jgi:O-antigen/teichoic acid export membrane protein
MSARSLTLASVSGIALLAVEVGTAFVVTPQLLSGLGAAQFGSWDILVGLIGYFGFLDLGVSPAIVRYVAHSQGKHDERSAHHYFGSGFWSLVIVGITFSVAIFALTQSVFFSGIFGAPDSSYLRSVTSVFAAIVGISLPLNILSAYLLGRQKNLGLNAFRMILVLLRSVGTVWAVNVESESRLLLLAEVFFFALVLEFLILAIWIAALEGIKILDPSLLRLGLVKTLLAYGLNSTLLMLGTGSLRRVVAVVIAKVVGLSEVVHYAVANRLVEYGQSLAVAVGYPLTAHLAKISGEGDAIVMRGAFLESARAVQFISLGVPVGIFCLGEPFLRRWLGPEVTPYAQGVLAILCASLFSQGLASNSMRMLLATATHRGAATFSAVTSPVLILVCIFATRNWGVYGAAGAVAAHGIANAVYEMLAASRHVDIPLTSVLRKTALPYAVPLSVMALTLFSLRLLCYPDSYYRIGLHTLLGAGIYISSVSWLVYRQMPWVLLRRLFTRN